jgi:hypothetical protein
MFLIFINLYESQLLYFTVKYFLLYNSWIDIVMDNRLIR